jgi:hypothetical protein
VAMCAGTGATPVDWETRRKKRVIDEMVEV